MCKLLTRRQTYVEVLERTPAPRTMSLLDIRGRGSFSITLYFSNAGKCIRGLFLGDFGHPRSVAFVFLCIRGGIRAHPRGGLGVRKRFLSYQTSVCLIHIRLPAASALDFVEEAHRTDATTDTKQIFLHAGQQVSLLWVFLRIGL